jgi:hypothetical protein
MQKLFFLSIFAAALAFGQVEGPLVTYPTATGVSPTLEAMARLGTATVLNVDEFRLRHSHDIPKATVSPSNAVPPPYVTVSATTAYNQNFNFLSLPATAGVNFEALGVGTPSYTVTGAPPDTTLGVSATQIVQWVNTHLAVYDKTGAPLLASPGFIPGNQIWSGLAPGSLCRDFNRGDPLVQYDRLSNRWILSQFAFDNGFSNNSQCIAVSQTSNATGAYYLYEYNFGNVLPDYGKLGVWPDAYYITYNMFTTGSSYAGGRACAYDRAAMLNGNTAAQICFNSTSRFSYLPSDLDGTTLPPAGTPNFHISWDWAFLAGPPYTMQLTKFVPNFSIPALSTFNDGFGGLTFSFVGFDLGSSTLAACNDNGNACVPARDRQLARHPGQPPHVPPRLPQLRHA